KESWLLVKGVKDEIDKVAISPDQKQIAFTTYRAVDGDTPDKVEHVAQLFKIETPSGTLGEVIKVGDCEVRCTGLAWRQDSELIVFVDHQRGYLSNSASISAETIFDLPIKSMRFTFREITWATNARTILLETLQGDGVRYMVYDFPTGAFIDVPDSFSGNSQKKVSWLQDSRLMVAINQPVVYRIDYDAQSIEIDETYDLVAENGLTGFRQLADGRFAFAQMHPTDPNLAGLYLLTSFSESPERISGMPVSDKTPTTVFWTPNEGSALFSLEDQSYLAAADGNLYQFSQFLSAVEWLPQSDAQR
ncbi:MAG: hypothetical protein AAF902_18320, partial [Chloroflexota bacterium]